MNDKSNVEFVRRNNMSDTISNKQKQLNYQEQFKRLDRALKQGFYLEAMFIEYAIIEDRCDSVLRYEGNQINSKNFVSIDKKLGKISKIAEQKKTLPNRYFSDSLIDDIVAWKGERNSLIHALLKKELTTEGLEKVAVEGYELARKLCNKANNYKRAIERKKTT